MNKTPQLIAPTSDLDPRNPARVEETYYKISHLLISEPELSYVQMGRKLGKTGRWVAIIVASDAFQSYHKERTDEAVYGIQRKTQTLVELATDCLIDRVETMGEMMKTSELEKIIDNGAKRLGFGVEKGPGVNFNFNIPVDASDLAAARARIHEQFGAKTAPAAEAEVLPLNSQQGDGARRINENPDQ